MFADRLIRELGESARYFRQHLSLRSSVDCDSHRTCVCIEACVWARCTRSSHISAENLKFEAGRTIANFARPPVGLQNCGHNSQSRKDHLIFFMLVARLEFMAFDQLLISLLLGCGLPIVIVLRRLFKRCLDVLIQFRLLNLGRWPRLPYAKLAHVAEGHRRAGRLLGVHSMTSSARGEPPQPSPSPRYYVEGYPRLRDDD